MKTTIIYDSLGHIWNVTYGDSMLPQGLNSVQVELPDNTQITGVEIADDGTVTPKYDSMPASDLIQLQKAIDDVKIEAAGKVSELASRLDTVAPEEKEPETLDEFKAAKKKEIGKACSETIYNGLDVKLSDGSSKHFSLRETGTFHDQLNLIGAQVKLLSGADTVEYHSDGEPCTYYSAADMQTIITAAMGFVSYHQTYCNSMNMWIAGCTDIESVLSISYGDEIPEEYQSDVLKTKLASNA